MKLSQKEKYLLIILAGILLLVASWFLVASQLRMKTDEIRTVNIELQSTALQYQAISAKVGEYQEEIPKLHNEKERITNMYPSNLTREDEIMFWANMENTFSQELALSSLSMGSFENVDPLQAQSNNSDDIENQDVSAESIENNEYENNTAENSSIDITQQLSEKQEEGMYLFKAPINFSFVATYQGLKDMLNYLLLNGERKNIETLSVMFDSATGNLSGSMDMNLYFMTGTGKSDSIASVPAVIKGVSDIFHTVNGASINHMNQSEADNTMEEEQDLDD